MWDVKAGDKVTLMRNVKWTNTSVILPEFGVVYTVREIIEGFDGKVGTVVAIRLVEIVNPVRKYLVGPGVEALTEIKYPLMIFRPVIQSKGMETLRAALHNPKLISEINPLDVRKIKVS